jgi:serine protease inhibitor
VIQGSDGNVVFSPASIQAATTLLMYGAGGDTRSEIKNSLKYSMTDNEIAESYKIFTDKIKIGDELKIGEFTLLSAKKSINKFLQNSE